MYYRVLANISKSIFVYGFLCLLNLPQFKFSSFQSEEYEQIVGHTKGRVGGTYEWDGEIDLQCKGRFQLLLWTSSSDGVLYQLSICP